MKRADWVILALGVALTAWIWVKLIFFRGSVINL